MFRKIGNGTVISVANRSFLNVTELTVTDMTNLYKHCFRFIITDIVKLETTWAYSCPRKLSFDIKKYYILYFSINLGCVTEMIY
jgi:hypothetical protein